MNYHNVSITSHVEDISRSCEIWMADFKSCVEEKSAHEIFNIFRGKRRHMFTCRDSPKGISVFLFLIRCMSDAET